VTGGLASRDIAGVVLDVEGTTTPVSFVYDVLFPYARHRLAEYVSTLGSDELAEVERALRVEHAEDVLRGESVPPPEWPASRAAIVEAIIGYLAWLMDRDRKSTVLKAVQGRIWQGGFRDGTLRGEVFEDVPRAFARWRATGVRIYIYSSGSVLAQRLLFEHSVAGDLTPCLDGYFDTAIGPKREASSYARIASALDEPARRLLFISDVQQELDAAAAAGFQTLLCVRGAEPVGSVGERVIHTFDDVR
jgi:enolase-phosphatase E1